MKYLKFKKKKKKKKKIYKDYIYKFVRSVSKRQFISRDIFKNFGFNYYILDTFFFCLNFLNNY